MLQLFLRTLDIIDAALQDYVAALPKAIRVKQGEIIVFQFEKQDLYHAVVMKLAFVQSTLRAALLLLRHGHIVQQGMLQRVLDEANEDILFLTYAITNGTITPLHERYLKAFWAEEFADFEDVTESHQSRDMVPRKKIRAYLAEIEGKGLDPSTAAKVGKVVSKTYSGFVHGAAPHIMELYTDTPPRFNTRGEPLRAPSYARDFANYIYRSLISCVFTAKLFGSKTHVDALMPHVKAFEEAMGNDFANKP